MPRAQDKQFVLHPLHSAVMRAFQYEEVHDSTSLEPFLSGDNCLLNKKYTNAKLNAYKKVAVHVLEYMENQGHLYRDTDGWWRLTVEK